MKHLLLCVIFCFSSIVSAEPTGLTAPQTDIRSEAVVNASPTPQPQAADSEQPQSATPTPSEQPTPTASVTPKTSPASPAAKQNSEENGYLILGVLALLVVIAIGTYMGADGSLVIYNGRFDFGLSLALMGLVFVPDEYVRVLTCILFILSLELSCRANSSLLKLLLVLPTKFGLPILTLLSGVLALGSVLSIFQDKDENASEKAKTIAFGIACAASFHFLTKLIRHLIEPQDSARPEAPQSTQENV